MPNLDSQARRAAKKLGLYASKPRGRRGTSDNHGAFTLMDPVTNTVIGGPASERCALSADDVIEYCRRLTA